MAQKCISETLKMLPSTAAEGGMLLDQINDKLAEVVRAVDGEGKPGELKLVLKFKRTNGAIAIDADVTSKVPRVKPDSTLLWATVEGNLVTENPAQRKLPFAEQAKQPTVIAPDAAQPQPAAAQAVEITRPALAVVEAPRAAVAMAG